MSPRAENLRTLAGIVQWSGIAGLMTALVLFLAQAASAANLVAADIAAKPDGSTQVQVLIQKLGDYNAFTIRNPYRLVFDVKSLKDAQAITQLRGGLITGTRMGRRENKTTRIVFDLAGPALLHEPTVQRIRSGDALITLPLQRVQPDRFIELDYSSDKNALAGRNAGDRLQGWFARRSSAQPGLKTGNVTASDLGKGWTAGAEGMIPLARAGTRGSKRKPVIVIDPGHGGKDPGTTVGRHVQEKELVLQFSAELARKLIATGRYQVYLTRNTDTFIPLRERTRLATQVGADLFLSVHADSHPDKSIRGASFYTLSEEASDEEAAALAARENAQGEEGHVHQHTPEAGLPDILIDLAQRESMNSSRQFAGALETALKGSWPVRKGAHKHAGFAVLKSPDMAAVLFEMGYLSNAKDERLLLSQPHRLVLADRLISAIDTHFRRRNRDTASR